MDLQFLLLEVELVDTLVANIAMYFRTLSWFHLIVPITSYKICSLNFKKCAKQNLILKKLQKVHLHFHVKMQLAEADAQMSRCILQKWCS